MSPPAMRAILASALGHLGEIDEARRIWRELKEINPKCFRLGHRPFGEACVFVRRLNLKSRANWIDYCKSGEKPDDIPAYPEKSYADAGWINLGDWLGTGIIAQGSIADGMIKLIEEVAIPVCMVGLLYALPNTQLTRRLEKEGRSRPSAARTAINPLGGGVADRINHNPSCLLWRLAFRGGLRILERWAFSSIKPIFRSLLRTVRRFRNRGDGRYIGLVWKRPIECSSVLYETVEAANRVGTEALKQILTEFPA